MLENKQKKAGFMKHNTALIEEINNLNKRKHGIYSKLAIL